MATVFAQLAAEAAAAADAVGRVREQVAQLVAEGPPDDWWENFFPRQAIPNPLDPSNRGPMRDPFADPLIFDPRGRPAFPSRSSGGGGGGGGDSRFRGVRSTQGPGGGSLVLGERSQRDAEQRADVEAWREYVRKGGNLNYHNWVGAGRPTEFRFIGGEFPGGSGGGFGPNGSRGRFGASATSGPARVSDETVATEVRGLRSDLRSRGGLL